jgi:peptide/nickel transport system substrate-binding protein
VVGIRPAYAVRLVLERLTRRHRRTRHGRHRTPLLAAAALVAGVAVTGLTTGSAGADVTEDPVTFTVALTDEVDSLNPFLGFQANSYEMWALTYDYMVGYSMEDMSPAPALATDWEASEDGLTWTFNIRTGVLWSDGEDLTAADIAYTYNRVLTGRIEGYNWSSYLNNVDTVTAPDDETVVLQLAKPNATLPLLPIPIMPEHIWSSIDSKAVKSYAAEPSDGQPVVGSGPFRLVEGTAGGSTFRFEANPDYYGGTPHVDQVVFRVYKTNDPAVQALLKGEVDFVEAITPLQVKALEQEENVTAQTGVSPYFNEIAFNVGAIDTETGEPLGDGNPALQDKAFRHALGWAVDNEQIVRTAYQGGAKEGTTVVPSAYGTWHWEPPDDVRFSFDLDQAAEELDAAGYEVGSAGTRTMPDGSPLGTLRLFARSEEKSSVDTLELFSAWLDELDIDSEITAMDSASLGEVILDGNFDVFQWGWYVEPDPDGILADFTCDQRGGLSDSWYCDEGYDAMYLAQGSELDDDKRVEIVTQMQQQLYEDAPYLVTAEASIGEAFRNDKFACFQPQPDPGGIWLVQYGARNYTLLRPADEAGDCDGVESAVGAVGSDSEGGPVAASAGASGNTMGGFLAGVASTLVVVAGVWMLQRRRTVDDRE